MSEKTMSKTELNDTTNKTNITYRDDAADAPQTEE